MAVLASAEEKCKLFMYYWIVLCLFYTFCCVSWWVLGYEALMLLIAGSIFQSSCLVLGVRVYDYVLMWVNVRLAFAVVRATNLCFCESHVHGCVGEVGVALMMELTSLMLLWPKFLLWWFGLVYDFKFDFVLWFFGRVMVMTKHNFA